MCVIAGIGASLLRRLRQCVVLLSTGSQRDGQLFLSALSADDQSTRI